ncbi:MAG: DUF222 domain-containing protein [Iamia sp.]
MEAVLDSPQVEAIDRLAAGVDDLLSAGLTPATAAEARRLILDLEVQARRLDAAKVELVDGIQRSGLHAVDGHASAKVMVRHHAKLSGPEAAQRARAAKALRDLPDTRGGVPGRAHRRLPGRSHRPRPCQLPGPGRGGGQRGVLRGRGRGEQLRHLRPDGR